MKRRKKIWMRHTDIMPLLRCPSCSELLNAATEVSLFNIHQEALTLTGNLTMCLACGVMLTFTDERGTVRILAGEEREHAMQLHPELVKMLSDWRRSRGPMFGSKSFRGN